MSTQTPTAFSDPPGHTFVSSTRYRALTLAGSVLLCIWVLVTWYMWLTRGVSWMFFLAALLFAALSLLGTHALFTSRLALSPDGVRYAFYGASYFAPWGDLKLARQRVLFRALDGLSSSQPIPPAEKTAFGRLMMTQPISFISLQPFGWPSDRLREDMERYAPGLLAEGAAP